VFSEVRWKSIRWKGKKRQKRRYVDYANSPLRTIEDKLLFILIYLAHSDYPGYLLEKYSRCLKPVANQVVPFGMHVEPGFSGGWRETSSPCRDLHLAGRKRATFSSRMARNGPSRRAQRPEIARRLADRKSPLRQEYTMCWRSTAKILRQDLWKARSSMTRKSPMKRAWSCRREVSWLRNTGFQGFALPT